MRKEVLVTKEEAEGKERGIIVVVVVPPDVWPTKPFVSRRTNVWTGFSQSALMECMCILCCWRGEEREVSSERWERKCRGGQGVTGTTSQGSITLTEHLTSFVSHPPF